MKPTELHFVDKLPREFDFDSSLLIFDRILLKKHKLWIEKFPHRYGVTSGEKLKSIESFPQSVAKLSQLVADVGTQNLVIVSFGGGSVGDFAGFFASVFRRGVQLIHFPSTWLAALDSSHGGKTALNVARQKNQLGTFYPAQKNFLVKSVLLSQPASRYFEAISEALKVGLIDSEVLLQRVCRLKLPKHLWNLLPLLIDAKLRIVEQDPFEKKGLRQVLNLGHTLGHVLESGLGLPHGTAVGLGLRFCLNWSAHKKYLSLQLQQQTDQLSWFPSSKDLARSLRKLKNIDSGLRADKKGLGAQRLRFVFVKRAGLIEVEEVSFAELKQEIDRQKLAYV